MEWIPFGLIYHETKVHKSKKQFRDLNISSVSKTTNPDKLIFHIIHDFPFIPGHLLFYEVGNATLGILGKKPQILEHY